MSDPFMELAREIRRTRTQAATTNQARHTSIEAGSIDEYDVDGNLSSVLGQQWDGTHTTVSVSGPKPPAPVAPSVESGPLSLTARWGGRFIDDAVSPMDFKHVEVEVSESADFEMHRTRTLPAGELGAEAVLTPLDAGKTYYLRLVARSQSGKASDPSPVVEGVPDDVSDTAARGKITVTDHPPTVADGADKPVNATWSVIDEAGAQVGFYRWDGAYWVKMPLDETILPAVNIGTGTYGTLEGVRLSANAIDGFSITGATFRTSEGTGSWSDAGLQISNPEGGALVNFPTNGDPLSLSASDVQIDRAQAGELTMGAGRVAQGGNLTIGSGIVAPSTAPTMLAGWQRAVKLTAPDDAEYTWNGLALWGDKWVRGVNRLGASDGDRLVIYNPNGGIVQEWPVNLDPSGAVTVIGDVCYVIGKGHGEGAKSRYIHGYDLNTGAQVVQWDYTRLPESTYTGALTTDGANLITAQVAPGNGELYVLKFEPATGNPVGDDLRTEWGLSDKDLTGLIWTDGLVYVQRRKAVRAFTQTDLTRVLDIGWYNPDYAGAGMLWVGGRPVVVSSSGHIWSGSTFQLPGIMQLCYTFTDGAHETDPSPVSDVGYRSRESVNVTITGLRGGLSAIMYANTGDGWVKAPAPVMDTSQQIDTLEGWSPAAPPTGNTFPNSDLGELRSTIGGFSVMGDGSGTWGPLTLNGDGTLTGDVLAFGPTNAFGGQGAALSSDPARYADGTGRGGYNNTLFGADAGPVITGGLRNTGVGNGVFASMTNGFYNDAFGDGALRDVTGPDTISGTPSQAPGSRNTGIGSNALAHTTTGRENVAIGRNAAHTNTTGNNNVAVGRNAYSGKYNTTQQDQKTASDIVAIGDNALFDTNADGNVGVGAMALYQNVTGRGNTAIGWHALYGQDGDYTTAVGYAAVSTKGVSNGLALGRGSNVKHNNAVALGANTATNVADSVAIGPRSFDLDQRDNPGYPPNGSVRLNVTTAGGKLTLRAIFPNQKIVYLAQDA